jgi:hypothetical protein
LKRADLDARTIETFYTAPEKIESVAVPRITNWSTGQPTKEQSIVIRTKTKIVALSEQGRPVRVFAIPTDADAENSVSWYETSRGDSIAVFDRVRAPRDPLNVSSEVVYRIGSDGVIKSRFELSLESGSPFSEIGSSAWGTAAAVPAPLALLAIDLGSAFLATVRPRRRAEPSSLLKDFAPALGAAVLLSGALAVLAWRRSRAFGLREGDQMAWAVFVLLFGLPAYVGFLLGRRWPVRLPCPSCQTQAPRDRPACASCAARFPDPALKGIEIFA